MNVTNIQMENLSVAVKTLSEMPNLTENQAEISSKAQTTIEELKAAKKAQSAHLTKYIAERRKTDKNYCRPKKNK